MILPTEKQIENCELMGWRYEGDGMFSKGELIGWFEIGRFWKE